MAVTASADATTDKAERVLHEKLSKRKNSDPLSGSGPTFWSGLRKDNDSDSDSAVSFNCSTVVSNPDDCISNCVS